MNREVFITCAVTGAGDTTGVSDRVPVTPAEIASAAIEAASAGAAVVHLHVRDPVTGQGSRDTSLYVAVVDRIRASGVDVVLNLTGGMGADVMLGSAEEPLPLDPEATDLAGASERLTHVEEILPELCTIDCGSMNWAGDENYVTVNTQGILRAMARRAQELGVRPELEVFDGGQLDAVRDLIECGLLDDPVMVQLCMGIRYGASDSLNSFNALVNELPPGVVFSAFSVGAMQLPYVALAAIAGGNARVGLEDNLYLARGELATNGQLVERAVEILEGMSVRVLTPAEVRQRLSLTAGWRGERPASAPPPGQPA
jgi:uncharacterized protein (DUF849 family)